MDKTLIDTLIVKQDVGSHEPRYKKAIIDFWSDGSVTWRPRETPVTAVLDTDSYVGDTNPFTN